MNRKTPIAGALVAAAALATPGVAAAHPSVYTDDAKVVNSPAGASPVTVTDQTRYLVTNHGYTFALRESNGATNRGMIDYKQLPSAYRNQPGFTKARVLSEGDTGAQPHATCRGVAALEAEGNILQWQTGPEGSDPFYGYIPFQKAAAGLDDDPADWIPLVKSLTGVDLNTVSDPAAECTGLGGTFTAADATQTTAASLASGQTAPLEAKVKAAETAKAAADKAKADAEAGKTSAEAAARAAQTAQAATQAEANALLARAQQLGLELTPLAVEMPGGMTAKSLAAGGTAVSVTGPASAPVALKLIVSGRGAKQLGLRSKVLATGTGALGPNGTGNATLTATPAAKAALRKAKGKLKVSLEATSGDRATATAGTVG